MATPGGKDKEEARASLRREMERRGEEIGKREKGSKEKKGEENRLEVRRKGRPTNVERLVRERALMPDFFTYG